MEREPSFPRPFQASLSRSLSLCTHPGGSGPSATPPPRQRGQQSAGNGGSWASLQPGAEPGRALAGRKGSSPSNHRGLGQDDAPSARFPLKRGHSEELAVATCAGAGSSHQRPESTEAGRALSRFEDLAVSPQKVVQGFESRRQRART